MNSMHNSFGGSGGYPGPYPGYVPSPTGLPYYNGYPGELSQVSSPYYGKPGTVPPGYSSSMGSYSAPPINNSSMYYQQYGLGYQYGYSKYGLGSNLGYSSELAGTASGITPPSLGGLQAPTTDLGLTGSMFSKGKCSGNQGSPSPLASGLGHSSSSSLLSPVTSTPPSPSPHNISSGLATTGATPSPPVDMIESKKDLDKMRRCQVCGQIFRLMSECLAHMKSAHAVHEPPMSMYSLQHGSGHLSQNLTTTTSSVVQSALSSSSRTGGVGAPDSPLMALERMGWGEKQSMLSSLHTSQSPLNPAYTPAPTVAPGSQHPSSQHHPSHSSSQIPTSQQQSSPHLSSQATTNQHPSVQHPSSQLPSQHPSVQHPVNQPSNPHLSSPQHTSHPSSQTPPTSGIGDSMNDNAVRSRLNNLPLSYSARSESQPTQAQLRQSIYSSALSNDNLQGNDPRVDVAGIAQNYLKPRKASSYSVSSIIGETSERGREKGLGYQGDRGLSPFGEKSNLALSVEKTSMLTQSERIALLRSAMLSQSEKGALISYGDRGSILSQNEKCAMLPHGDKGNILTQGDKIGMAIPGERPYNLQSERLGVIPLGDRSSMVSPGERMGLMASGERAAMLAQAERMGIVPPGERPGIVPPGERPGIVPPGERSGIVSPGERPGIVSPGERPGIVSPVERLEMVPTTEKSGIMTAEKGIVSPGDRPSMVSPGESPGTITSGEKVVVPSEEKSDETSPIEKTEKVPPAERQSTSPSEEKLIPDDNVAASAEKQIVEEENSGTETKEDKTVVTNDAENTKLESKEEKSALSEGEKSNLSGVDDSNKTDGEKENVPLPEEKNGEKYQEEKVYTGKSESLNESSSNNSKEESFSNSNQLLDKDKDNCEQEEKNEDTTKCNSGSEPQTLSDNPEIENTNEEKLNNKSNEQIKLEQEESQPNASTMSENTEENIDNKIVKNEESNSPENLSKSADMPSSDPALNVTVSEENSDKVKNEQMDQDQLKEQKMSESPLNYADVPESEGKTKDAAIEAAQACHLDANVKGSVQSDPLSLTVKGSNQVQDKCSWNNSTPSHYDRQVFQGNVQQQSVQEQQMHQAHTHLSQQHLQQQQQPSHQQISQQKLQQKPHPQMQQQQRPPQGYSGWPGYGTPGNQYPYGYNQANNNPNNTNNPMAAAHKTSNYHPMSTNYNGPYGNTPSTGYPSDMGSRGPPGSQGGYPQGHWYSSTGGPMEPKPGWNMWSGQGHQTSNYPHQPYTSYPPYPGLNQQQQQKMQIAGQPHHHHQSLQKTAQTQPSSQQALPPQQLASLQSQVPLRPQLATTPNAQNIHNDDQEEEPYQRIPHIKADGDCEESNLNCESSNDSISTNNSNSKKQVYKIGPKSRTMAAKQYSQIDDLDDYKCTITVHENGSLNGYGFGSSNSVGTSSNSLSYDSSDEENLSEDRPLTFAQLRPAKRRKSQSRDGVFIGPKRVKQARIVRERQERRHRHLEEQLRQNELEEQIQASRVEKSSEEVGPLGNMLVQSSILLSDSQMEEQDNVDQCIAIMKAQQLELSASENNLDIDSGEKSTLNISGQIGVKKGKKHTGKVFHNENSVIVKTLPKAESLRKLRAKDFKWSHYIKSMRYWCSDCAHGFKNQKEVTMHSEDNCKRNCLYMLECYVIVKDVQAHPQFGPKVQELLEEYQVDGHHKCKTCGEIIERKADFVVHCDSHKDFMPWECTICGTRFKIRGSLKEHLRYTHMKGRVPCLKCNKVFPTSTLLRQHVKVHTQHYKYKSTKNRDEELKVAMEATDCALEPPPEVTDEEAEKLSEEANEYRNWCKLMELNAMKNIGANSTANSNTPAEEKKKNTTGS